MVALTGSIATGKSTVCKILKENGYKIVDADIIARELINAEKIEGIFGKKYARDGIIDRKALGDLVFNNQSERAKLNEYIHPLIRDRIYKEVDILEKNSIKYIVDIPLYFESGHYDGTIVSVVYCPKELQMQRLIEREKLSKVEAIKRIESQIDIEYKKKKADFVIDNSKDLAHLVYETKKFMEYLDANIKI